MQETTLPENYKVEHQLRLCMTAEGNIYYEDETTGEFVDAASRETLNEQENGSGLTYCKGSGADVP